ncbi:MAG: lipase maturation factor family protein, partial [Myxococcota bacterium]|nr:lipase maturation factor family protein [Myxococcota bacterium]
GFTVLAAGRGLLRKNWFPEAISSGVQVVSGLRSFNSYGLFRVMTRTRPELILEASLDGKTWEAWPTRWKPWSPDLSPRWTGLHMPRLDWQLWFEALAAERNRQSPWAQAFLLGVLEDREPVVALLGPSPFGDQPAVGVRMRLDQFQFSSPSWREQSGQWWFTETQRLYAPPIGLSR